MALLSRGQVAYERVQKSAPNVLADCDVGADQDDFLTRKSYDCISDCVFAGIARQLTTGTDEERAKVATSLVNLVDITSVDRPIGPRLISQRVLSYIDQGQDLGRRDRRQVVGQNGAAPAAQPS